MLNRSSSIGVVSALRDRSVSAHGQTHQPVLLTDLAAEAQAATLKSMLDDETSVEWSEEDVVFLHWRLLKELDDLSDPGTPLDEKLDTLRWVFTDPELEGKPFSFVSCLKVVGCSPLSPTPYFGALDAEAIRDWIKSHLREWLDATLVRYPAWVRQSILDNPAWIESRLAKNPQWINEELKKRTIQGDLFA